MPEENILAFCGLECTQCPAYVSTQTGNEELRRETAEKWSSPGHEIDPDDIMCDGCLQSKRLSGFCHICGVRKCASGKGLPHCAECDDYVCGTLEDLWGIIKSPDARENLDSLQR